MRETNDEERRDKTLTRGWSAHAVDHLSSPWKSLRAAAPDPERARYAVTDTIAIGPRQPAQGFRAIHARQMQELAPQPATARA
jgi:hypothetical protein